MEIGDYVSLQLPSSSRPKLVAGLIEAVNTDVETATVRVRGTGKADELITVPISSLQPLGVRAPLSSSSSSTVENSRQNLPNNSNQNQFAVDSTSTHLMNEHIVSTTDSSRTPLKQRSSRPSFYQRGVMSKYLWEFLSPLASLLRCERPLFTIGLLIVFVMAEVCRTLPLIAFAGGCSVVDQMPVFSSLSSSSSSSSSSSTFANATNNLLSTTKTALVYTRSKILKLPPRGDLLSLCHATAAARRATQKDCRQQAAAAAGEKTKKEAATSDKEAPSMMGWRAQHELALKQLPDHARAQILSVAKKFYNILFCAILCLMWSSCCNCELPSSSSSSYVTFYLLEDCDADDDDNETENENDEEIDNIANNYNSNNNRHNNKFNQKSTRKLSQSSTSSSESHEETLRQLRALELEVYRPDVALQKFFIDFKGVLLFHAAIIVICCLVSYGCSFEKILASKNKNNNKVNDNDKKNATTKSSSSLLSYRNSYAEVVLSPFGTWIVKAVEMHQSPLPTLEQWLLSSILLNALIALLGVGFKKVMMLWR